MIARRLLYPLFVVAALLIVSGCQPQAAPSLDAPDTPMPARATAAPPPIAVLDAALAPAPVALIDDATQARLRLASLVAGGPDTDFKVDSAIALLGSDQRELRQVPAGFINRLP